MDTVTRGETIESELDGLIRRRHDQRLSEEQGRVEDGWAESVRRHHAHQQQELARQWLDYHVARQRANRRTFSLLDAHHEAEIRRYSELLGIDAPEPNGKDAA